MNKRKNNLKEIVRLSLLFEEFNDHDVKGVKDEYYDELTIYILSKDDIWMECYSVRGSRLQIYYPHSAKAMNLLKVLLMETHQAKAMKHSYTTITDGSTRFYLMITDNFVAYVRINPQDVSLKIYKNTFYTKQFQWSSFQDSRNWDN